MRGNIMKVIDSIPREKIFASFIFPLTSWILLYLWLYLAHAIDEQVSSTVLSSPMTYACIAITALSFMTQKRTGALRELIIITFWLVLIFIYSIVIFNILLNITPDMYDIVFYYKCFLLVLFYGSPVYLIMRMI
jgi:hypothetical protein